MADVRKVKVECSYLKSLPNYENIRFTAGVELDVKPNEDVNEVFKEGWDIAGDQIEKQLELFEQADTSKMQKGLK